MTIQPALEKWVADSVTSPLMKRVASVLIPIFAAVLPACSDPVAPVDFSKYERSVFSQHGEDGVIEKIFELIEPTHRYAVEFGAGNGIRNNNTRNLMLNKGWRGLQIEGDPERAAEARAAFADLPQVKVLEAWVYPGNIETLFEDNGVPLDFDLLVIDIDSNDYYIWKVIHKFRPKVVEIEINPFFPPPQLMVIKFHPLNFWDHTDYSGASIASMIKLGKEKGYEPLYVPDGGFNLFFVDQRYFDRFGIADNSPAALYKTANAEAEHYFNRDPHGRGEVPFEDPYLDFGHVKIKKEFLFDR